MVVTGAAIVLLVLLQVFSPASSHCAETEFNKCIEMAAPLKDPANAQNVALICKIFNNFIDCTEDFMDRCTPADQRDQFFAMAKNMLGAMDEKCAEAGYARGGGAQIEAKPLFLTFLLLLVALKML